MRSMKKRWSRVGMVASVVAIVALGLTVSVTEGDSGKGKKGKLVLDVNVDEGSLDTPHGMPGPFHIEGEIVGGGGGTFECWGWIDAGFIGRVSQVYALDDRGSIMTQGLENDFLGVTGGTGDFSNVRGEALQTFTGNGFDFIIEFDLKGAKK